jgi:hypothetical protein
VGSSDARSKAATGNASVTRGDMTLEAVTSFGSANELASALRRAAAAHGEHEKRMGGEYDTNWPDWYAAYMVAEQAGTELPT